MFLPNARSLLGTFSRNLRGHRRQKRHGGSVFARHFRIRRIPFFGAGRNPCKDGGQLEKGYADTEELVKMENDGEVDILAIPGEQLRICNLHYQASALEAWRLMDVENVDAVYVTGTFDAYAPALSGIITRHDIDNYYHSPRNF